MIMRNKSSARSTETLNFNRSLIGIFLGYTLWFRKRREIMTVKKQQQPSQGPPELLYLQNSKQKKMITDSFQGGRRAIGKKIPGVLVKRLENKLQRGIYRQDF